MTWLQGAGFPVPAVREASGRDLVMQRVAGRTMLADLEVRPWMGVSHMGALATIQRSLNAIAAPEWIRVDERIPPGTSVVHLDLHPMNVILSPNGPIVIDWTNVGRADADFDAAMSFVLMATFEAHGIREVNVSAAVDRAKRLDERHALDGSPPGANPSSGMWRLVVSIRG